MKLSLKLFCPDCGAKSSWLNYLFRRFCPNCRIEFCIAKSYLFSCALVLLLIASMVFLCFKIELSLFFSSIAIILSTTVVLLIFPLNIRLVNKKKAKKLSLKNKSKLRASYIFQAFLLALSIFSIMLALLGTSKHLKLSLPDYLLELYPSFTKITMWIIPATEQLFFASAGVVAGGYFLFALIMILSCQKRKLFSCGIRLLENSYKIILFIAIFALAGLFIAFVPYYLNFSVKAGESAINIFNHILWVLFFLTPLLIWLVRKKSNHSMPSLNKKIILLSLINPILISLFLFLIIMLMADLSSGWFEGEPMPLLMEFLIGKNYTYKILATLFVICCYFVIFTKNSHSEKKLRYKINLCLPINRFSLLTLLIYTCIVAHFISYTCMGYTQCMCGGHEPWNLEIYPSLNWLALEITVVTAIFIVMLARKFKNRNKCKWVYLTGILIFAVFYLPVNKKIHPTVSKIGFINKHGKIVIAPKFANAGVFISGICNASLTKFSFLNRAGFINKKGEWVIAPKFISTYLFSDGFASVTPSLRSMSRFINKKGEFFNTKEYKKASPFFEGLARVEIGRWDNCQNKSKNGYINTKGELVILSFNDYRAGNFSEGLARILVKANIKGEAITSPPKNPPSAEELLFPDKNEIKNNFNIEMVTFIDKSGNFAIKNNANNPMLFLSAGNFSEDLAWVELKIDSKGKIIDFPKTINDTNNDDMFGNNGDDNKSSNKTGFINKSGYLIIKPQFDSAEDFKEGMAPVKLNEKWGFVNPKGQVTIKPKYAEVYGFSGGLARVKSSYKYGFIDKSGKEVIPVIYDGARDFSEGLAAIQKDGLWGYIDKTGQFVIKPQFYNARPFSEGLAAVGVKMDY